MKREISLLAMVAVAVVIFCGCVVHRTIREPSGSARKEAGVPETPPAPKLEVIGEAPGSDAIWVAGYWSWPEHWEWVPGKWVARPVANAVPVAGRWIQRNDYWAWVPAHWKERMVPPAEADPERPRSNGLQSPRTTAQ